MANRRTTDGSRGGVFGLDTSVSLNQLAGAPGPAGATGPQGTAGREGSDGAAGPTGDEGPRGGQGIQGVTGNTGADSTVAGPEGPVSTTPGPQGEPGADSVVPGPPGADSTVAGPQGEPGADSTVAGPEGPVSTTPGPIGLTGDTGPRGLASTVAGPQGEIGPVSTTPGPAGMDSTVAGPAGPTGPASTVAGPPGADSTVEGPAGPTGPASTVEGPAGPPGADSIVPGPAGADSTVAGPAGADSVVPGPPGADSVVPGPAGADSVVPGPAGADSVVPGPAGMDSTVAGPQGEIGPMGAASTVAGPPGADSTVAGPQGEIGPMGLPGDDATLTVDDVALEGSGQATSGAPIVAVRVFDVNGLNPTWHAIGATPTAPENPMSTVFTTQRFEQGINGGDFTNTLDVSVDSRYGIASTLHDFRVTRADGTEILNLAEPTLSGPTIANSRSTRTVTFTFPEILDNTAETFTVHFQPTISSADPVMNPVSTVNPAFNESFVVFVPALSFNTVVLDPNTVARDSDAGTHMFSAQTSFVTGIDDYDFVSTNQLIPTIDVDDINFDTSTIGFNVLLDSGVLTYTATFPVGYENDTRIFTFSVRPVVIRENGGTVPVIAEQVWTFTVAPPADLTDFYYGVSTLFPSALAGFSPPTLSNTNVGPYALMDAFTMDGAQDARMLANSFIVAIPNSIRSDDTDLDLQFREPLQQTFSSFAGGDITGKGTFWNSTLVDIGNTQYYVISVGLTDTGGDGTVSQFFTDQWRLI